MVFSSLPLYLDPPNWQQHPNDQQQQQHQQHQHQHHLQGSSVGAINESQHHHQHQLQHQHQLIIPSHQVPQTLGSNVQPHQVGLGGAPIRPNSMAERARAAKIPAPETPLKCPRCDSSNTKFCYFNNYSLTQPRHFCKACRRYWTRGGALRNVPVGGGCRRNKRSSSKSSGGGGATSSSSSRSSLSSPSTAAIGGGGAMDNIIGSTIMGHAIPGLPSGGGGMTSFMASLQNMANLGLTFGGLHAPSGAHPLGVGGLHPHMDFNNNDHLMMSQQQHQHAQFPNNNNNLLGGFEQMGGGGSTPSGSLYSSAFQGVSGSGGGGGGSGRDDDDDQHQVNDVNVLNKGCLSTTMMLSQLAPVKMEGSGQGINLAKQLMMGTYNSNNNIGGGGGSGGNDNQFWGCPIPNANTMGATTTSMWTDVSGLNSSSMN